MSQPSPTWPDDPSIIDDPPTRLRPTMYQAISRKVAQQNKQPTGLISGLLPPKVSTPAAADSAGGAVPIRENAAGQEITHHESVRCSDPSGRKYNTNTASRFVLCDSEGGSPVTASGSDVDEGTTAAINQHFGYDSDAPDLQRLAIEQCEDEFGQRLYTLISGGTESLARRFQPRPPPKLLINSAPVPGTLAERKSKYLARPATAGCLRSLGTPGAMLATKQQCSPTTHIQLLLTSDANHRCRPARRGPASSRSTSTDRQ